MSRAERNIAWIEQWCRVPEGRGIGRPLRLREWQKEFLRRVYDNPAGTRQAILSMGRKNGKTALSASLLLLHLAGPEAIPNSQLYSAAQSREQAGIVFRLASQMVRLNPDLEAVVRVKETAKTLVCDDLGTTYRALSADASTAYGLSPIFAIHDELGQVRGPRSELYDAIETGMGAHDRPLSIVISTQAPTDADLLSLLIDGALEGSDPRTICQLYTAPPHLDPFSEEALRAANPAFGDFLNRDELLRQAQDVQRLPSREPNYRNYHLNQRINTDTPFISQALWTSLAKPPAPLDGLPVYGGLDLSSVSDLTALVLVGVDEQGIHHVHPEFWLPADGLVERARADRAPYDIWARQGDLHATPGRSISYEWVSRRIYEIVREYEVAAIGFDRWNFRHLAPWLSKAGFSDDEIGRIFRPLGQGYQTMSPALRELEALALDGKIRHGGHPVLTMCAANAVVTSDPAGNRKLDKARSTGRIDGMVALAMAVAVAAEARAPGKRAPAAPSPWENPDFSLLTS